MPVPSALLVLADGRLPAGGHAHSGGAEEAVADGRVSGPADLYAYCLGRAHTTGLVAASLAAAAADGLDPLVLDHAADARTPSPALRAAARRLGRQLLRAARAAWPDPALDAVAARHPRGLHQPVVLGLTARAAGLGPADAAAASLYESVGGPASATVRLLSLDPLDATRVLARLAPVLDTLAAEAVAHAARARTEGPDALPARAAPLLDLAAEHHARRPHKLFTT
ncbi:urease accessory protein UreF [Streptomyces sp. NPDC001255]|uniref:urease accessory protein UreF n=1 Tax=Streptomyces sp. NPDC001255 TaxID=3364550 RepID=UPI0036B96433